MKTRDILFLIVAVVTFEKVATNATKSSTTDKPLSTEGNNDTTKAPSPTEGEDGQSTQSGGNGGRDQDTKKEPSTTKGGDDPTQQTPTKGSLDGQPTQSGGNGSEDMDTTKEPSPTKSGGDRNTTKEPSPTKGGDDPTQQTPTEGSLDGQPTQSGGNGSEDMDTTKEPSPTKGGDGSKQQTPTEGILDGQPTQSAGNGDGDRDTSKEPSPTKGGDDSKQQTPTEGSLDGQPTQSGGKGGGDGDTTTEPSPTKGGEDPKEPTPTKGGPDGSTPGGTGKPTRHAPIVKAKAQLKLDQKFTAELDDPESTEFKELASGFQTEMDGVMKQAYNETFNRTEVNGFSNGSILVDFTLFLNGEPEQASSDNLASALETVIATATQDGGSLSDYGIVEGSVGVKEVEVFTQAPETNDGGESGGEDGGSSGQGLQCFTCFMSGDTEDETCLEPQAAENVEHTVDRCNLGEKCWTYAYRRDDIFHNFTRACGPTSCPDPGDDEELCNQIETDGRIEMCSKCCSTDHCNDHEIPAAANLLHQSLFTMFTTLLIHILVQVFY